MDKLFVFAIFMVFLAFTPLIHGAKPKEAKAKPKSLVQDSPVAKEAEAKPKQVAKKPKSSKKPQKSPKSSPSLKNLTEGLDLLNKPTKKQRRKRHTKALNRQGNLSRLSSRSLLVLAQAYEQKGDYENQVLTLRKLVQRSKKHGLYLLELAKGLRNLYFKTGLFKHREEAIKIINQVYDLKNKKYRERAHLEMLALLKFEEDSDETKYAILKLLQSLIREFGIKKNYVRDICQYLYINKFYGQSLASCAKAIKYYPKEPKNHIYYALSLKDEVKKEQHLKKTAKQFGKSPFVQLTMGQFLIERKDYALALPYFKKATREEPDSAPAQVGLAQALFHTGREKESYKLFLKACMLDKPKMLWAFKQAKSILNQKSRFALASVFDKGITQCFLKAKNPKKNL